MVSCFYDKWFQYFIIFPFGMEELDAKFSKTGNW